MNKLVIYKGFMQKDNSHIMRDDEIILEPDTTYDIVEFRTKNDKLICTISKQEHDELLTDKRTRRPIQQIVPHLSEDQREFILTGLTGEEFDDMFEEK